MNSSIQAQLAQAHAEINERGELLYSARVRLLRSFDEAPAKTALGWMRRASLAIRCSRHCTDLWAEKGSGIELARVLDFAEQCLRERSMFTELEGVAENLQVEVDKVLATGES